MPFNRRNQTSGLIEAAKRVAAGTDKGTWDKALIEARNDGGFHWKDDVYFKRLDGGSVRMRVFGEWNYTPNWEDFVIDPSAWASIVCNVSADGETFDRWNAAQDFHGRLIAKDSGDGR